MPMSPVDVAALTSTTRYEDSAKLPALPPPAPDRATDVSVAELLLLTAIGFAVVISIVSLSRGYRAAIDGFGDSPSYMGLARAIREWDFRGVEVKQFWGLPYGMAALSKLTGASDCVSLIAISLLSSMMAVLLARRLWNGWIAAYFAILNFDWLQRSCLGGSEPLFMACLLAGFVFVRQRRWLLASLFCALATVVRPLGVFALVGIGLTLLWKKEYGKAAAATAVGLAIGILYALPLAAHFGDPLATVHSYHSREWQDGWLFGVPFYAIIKGTILYPAPWTNLILSFAWIFLVVAATGAMIKSQSFHEYCRARWVEAIFLVPYLWCLFAYNYPYWARGNFARFAIPVLPFVILVLYRWFPKDRRVLWALGLIVPALAAVSALGVANVARLLRETIR